MRSRKEIEQKMQEYKNLERVNNPFSVAWYQGAVEMAKWVLRIE